MTVNEPEKHWAHLFASISAVAIGHAFAISAGAGLVTVIARYGLALLCATSANMPSKEDVTVYGFLLYSVCRRASHGPFAVGTYLISPFVSFIVTLATFAGLEAVLWIYVAPDNSSAAAFIAIAYPTTYYFILMVVIFPLFVDLPLRQLTWSVVGMYFKGMEIAHAFMMFHLLLFMACFYLRNQKASYNLNNQSDSEQYRLYFLATLGMGLLLPGLRVLSNMAANLTDAWKPRTPADAEDERTVIRKNIVFHTADFWAGVQLLIVFREINLPYFVLSYLISDSFFLAERIASVILLNRAAQKKLNSTSDEEKDDADEKLPNGPFDEHAPSEKALVKAEATDNVPRQLSVMTTTSTTALPTQDLNTRPSIKVGFKEGVDTTFKEASSRNTMKRIGTTHLQLSTKTVVEEIVIDVATSTSSCVTDEDVPFVPISLEAHHALRRLALIANEWKGRLSAMVVTILFLTISPTAEWMSCYVSYDIREALRRISISIMVALTFDLLGFIVEIKFGSFDYATALRCFNMNAGGFHYCSMNMASIVGIWLIAETGISDANMNTCFQGGRKIWHGQ